MKSFTKFLWIFACLSIACSGTSSKKQHAGTESPEIIPAKFGAAPVFFNTEKISMFIDSLAIPRGKHNYPVETVKRFICQPLIDESGNVVEIAIHSRVNPTIDSTFIAAIRNSTFNSFRNAATQAIEKYSLFLNFYVTDTYIINPYGTSEKKIEKADTQKKAPKTFQPFDTAPEPIGGFSAIQRNLRFPEIARRAGIQGKVIVNVLVDEKGKVAGYKILESLSYPQDEAAVDAILSVKWKPATQKGKPVKVWVGIPIIFKLNS